MTPLFMMSYPTPGVRIVTTHTYIPCVADYAIYGFSQSWPQLRVYFKRKLVKNTSMGLCETMK